MKKYLIFSLGVYVYVLLTISLFLLVHGQKVPLDLLENSYNLILSVTASFVLLWLSIILIKLNRIDSKVNTVGHMVNINYGRTRSLLVSISALLLFLYFVINKVPELSIESLRHFTTNYRYGVYSGSGMFTVGVTYFVSTFLLIAYFFVREINTRYLHFLLFLYAVCVFILGFRVLLLPLVIGFLLYYSDLPTKRILRFLFFLLGLLLFFAAFKFAIDASTGFDRDLFASMTNAFVRQKIPFLLNINTNSPSDILHCGLPLAGKILSCSNPELLKQDFFTPHLSALVSGFPRLNLYSGIAIPLPVVLYNIYGPFVAAFFLYCFLLVILFFVYITFNDKASVLFRFISLIFVTRMTGAIIEDYYTWFASIPLTVFVVCLLYFSIFLRFKW